jgi:hypothetical protein
MFGGRRTVAIRGIIVALALLSAATVAPHAAADQTFHTEQIPLMAVGGAPLQSGFVVDVHANGPTIFAQERYVLVGATSNTSYQVQLNVYPSSDTSCSGATLLPPIQEARLVTNGVGNGEAGFTFTPPGPPAGIYNLQWQVLNGSTVAYETACTPVAVD